MKGALDVGLFNNVNVLNITDIHLKNGWDDKFYVLCILPQFLKSAYSKRTQIDEFLWWTLLGNQNPSEGIKYYERSACLLHTPLCPFKSPSPPQG